jgi:hypothetical protein
MVGELWAELWGELWVMVEKYFSIASLPHSGQLCRHYRNRRKRLSKGLKIGPNRENSATKLSQN